MSMRETLGRGADSLRCHESASWLRPVGLGVTCVAVALSSWLAGCGSDSAPPPGADGPLVEDGGASSPGEGSVDRGPGASTTPSPGAAADGGPGAVGDAPEAPSEGPGSGNPGSGADGGPGADSGATPGSPSGECLSGGSGGAAVDVTEQPFTDSGGQRSSYHLYASEYVGDGSLGLFVFLHGDGGYSFDHPRWILDDMVRSAKGHGFLPMSVRTPGRDDTWWGDASENGAYLVELLEAVVLSGYNIDLSRVLLVGYSGGGDFYSSWFLPNAADMFCGGGAVIFGGGFPPYRRVPAGFPSAAALGFKLHFYTGMRDPYLDDSQSGVSFYRDHGFDVTEEHPSGVGHEDIPFLEVVEQQLAAGLVR